MLSPDVGTGWPLPSLDELLRMPWWIEGPTLTPDADGDYWAIRVRELPEFVVYGETREVVLAEYTPALTAFLESYTLHGELPPVPRETLWGWLAAERRISVTTGTAMTQVWQRPEKPR